MQKRNGSIKDKFYLTFVKLLGMSALIMSFAITLAAILFTQSQIDLAIQDLEDGLIEKGNTLVKNNSLALLGMVEDNAISAVQELVIATVKEDKDIIYGIFMDVEGRAWVNEDAQLGVGINNMPQLDDPMSTWASNLRQEASRRYVHQLGEVIEFAAPIFFDNSERLGTIRYGLQTEGLRIKAEQIRTATLTSLYKGLTLLLVGTLVIFALGMYLSKRAAASIASPIKQLASAANRISQGDYTQTVVLDTDCEVMDLANSFESMRQTIREYTDNLEHLVEERTKQLKVAQEQAVNNAHKAGMAEIATGVLHNIGNILNSAIISAHMLQETAGKSSVSSLVKANDLLENITHNINNAISDIPKVEKLFDYYAFLEKDLSEENEFIKSHISRLLDKLQLISQSITAQLEYAKTTFDVLVPVDLCKIIDTAVSLNQASLNENGIEVEKGYDSYPIILGHKNKALHIFVNLITNARDAMIDRAPDEKKIIFHVYSQSDAVCVTIRDTGKGIKSENLDKIFNYGFTSKKNSYGFGLHSCANYMEEMQGGIVVESDGEGKGATFSLTFRCASEEDLRRGAIDG